MKEKSNLEATPLRYAGVATLLRRPVVNDPSGVDIALIGVPYDVALPKTDRGRDMDLGKSVICQVLPVPFIMGCGTLLDMLITYYPVVLGCFLLQYFHLGLRIGLL